MPPTARLAERDAVITTLEDELDAAAPPNAKPAPRFVAEKGGEGFISGGEKCVRKIRIMNLTIPHFQ